MSTFDRNPRGASTIFQAIVRIRKFVKNGIIRSNEQETPTPFRHLDRQEVGEREPDQEAQHRADDRRPHALLQHGEERAR